MEPLPLPTPEDDERIAHEMREALFDSSKSFDELSALVESMSPEVRDALGRHELRVHIRGGSLKGHEGGEDLELAAEQVQALARAVHAVDTPVATVAGRISRDFESYLSGEMEPPTLSLPDFEFEAVITPALLRELIDQPARTTGIEAVDTFLNSPFGVVHSALMRYLRDQGVLRGPCPRCSRPEWPVKLRPPGAKGRPPLSYEYCPSCLVERERARRAGNQRRFREKVKSNQTPSHQDPAVDAAIYGGPSSSQSKRRPSPRNKGASPS